IWLKDYLQLDGLAYKFVPILTPSKSSNGRPKSVLDLGRIDTETMYNNVKKWDWKNSNSNIYVDVETRKNGIVIRNNLIRLAEELIIAKKYVKAEEILDLSIEKMPIKKYGHVNFVLGYPDAYYQIGNKEKAKYVANTLVDIFRDRIEFYSGLDNNGVSQHYDDIEGTLMMYNNIVVTVDENDKELAEELKIGYVASIRSLQGVIE
ncbi:hypothetical protein JBL43_19935, partial [Aureibaculum sp. A20]|nr:hypothetical protein [Aureibaculum flavum]